MNDVNHSYTGSGWRFVRLLKKALTVLVLLLLVTEVGVRFSGLVDFPIYTVESAIGYIPTPSQSGTFFNKNPWVFNDRSMGTESNHILKIT